MPEFLLVIVIMATATQTPPPKEPEIKTCPLCKKQFKCYDSPECWCNQEEIQELIPRLQPYIKRITGCVCENCIRRAPPLKPIKKQQLKPVRRNPMNDVPQPSTYSG